MRWIGSGRSLVPVLLLDVVRAILVVTIAECCDPFCDCMFRSLAHSPPPALHPLSHPVLLYLLPPIHVPPQAPPSLQFFLPHDRSALDHEVQQWHARLEDELHALLLGATRSPDSSRVRWPGLGPRLCAVRAAQTRVEILWRAWRRVRRRLDGPRGMAAAARSGAAVEAALAALRLAASGLVDEWARQLERQLPGLQQDLQGSVLQRVPATGVLQPGLGPDSRRLIAEAAGLVVIEAPIAIITEVRVAVPGALEGLRAVRGALHAVHAARREAAPFPAACRRAAAALDRRLLAGVGALRWSSPAHQRAFWLRDVADLAAALGAAASAARAMRGAGEPAWGSLARMGFLPTGRDPYSQEDLQRHIDRLQECIEDGTRAVQDALSQHAGSDPDMEGLAQEANLAYCGVVEGMVDRACAAIAAERLAPEGGETVRDGRWVVALKRCGGAGPRGAGCILGVRAGWSGTCCHAEPHLHHPWVFRDHSR